MKLCLGLRSLPKGVTNGKAQREILVASDHFPYQPGAGLMTGVRAAEEVSIRAMPES
jgi:hypothetical protein